MREQTPQKPTRRRFAGWRFTRRTAAILVTLLMVAAPAGASIIVQNYMEADITASPPCFFKDTGKDAANSTQAQFSADPDVDVALVDGVNLLEEKISVNGMTGDRVIYTDVVRYINKCEEPIVVQLTNAVATGDWDNVAAEIWLSNIEGPANIDPNLDSVDDDDWQDTHIQIDSTGVVVGSTGLVQVLPGGQLQGAFVVSSDVAFTNAAPDPDVATANWVAQATIAG